MILDADIPGEPYVQLAVHPSKVLAEVRDDEFAYAEGPLLDPRVTDALVSAGWTAPGTWESGKPQWWREWKAPYDLDPICEELVWWFATGFGLTEDMAVTLSVLPGDDVEDADQPVEVPTQLGFRVPG